MKKYVTFWILFFILFLLFVFPTTNYFSTGIPDFLQRTTTISKFWFISHIVSGIFLYIIAPFQFSTYVRRKYLPKHRLLGKIFIILSFYCICTLYLNIIPNGLCDSCRPSNYLVTTLWLLFIIAAYISIRQKKVILHQRLMISAFICAAYFVVVRVIDKTSMNFFKSISGNESQAYLISDIASWFIPLSIIWTYWIIQNAKTSRAIVS